MKTMSFIYRLFILILISDLLSGSILAQNNSGTGPGSEGGVAVLMVDADRPAGKINKAVYGQFLEHINHSVVDGLFAEQIQGWGFEGKDFETFWKPIGVTGGAAIVEEKFKSGEKSLELSAVKGSAGIRQERIYLIANTEYNGSLWMKKTAGSLKLTLRFRDSANKLLKEIQLKTPGNEWTEVGYSFVSSKTDPMASVEIEASGTGTLYLDYFTLMRADVRKSDMMRPDLVKALNDLKPPFIRWPGGSFASIYYWKDGIGPHEDRKYHPNTIWGGYSDYYGFGTDEFMELCRQLNTEPLIVLNATTTDPEQVKYGMDWVHYLNDPPTTEWGKIRAANGHPEPYNVKYFQIDNEPMNHGLTPEKYAEIVNAFGSELRKIAPDAKIVACGQKRSNDLAWSQKIIDLAGKNFDILGCHNYEYENENYQTGLLRINDYLVRLRDFIRNSQHPGIELAILEWGLCRSYDWRAGLHTAGSLMMYEKLGPELTMTCPALLLRNTTDDPTWTSFIYHDHVTWFPGGGYVVEKLFSEHYAENYLASATGTFRDIRDRKQFFNNISQMRPEDWTAGTVDAVATRSADGKKIIIKTVNYIDKVNTLLTRIQGASSPVNADVRIYTLSAGPTDKASIENPEFFKVTESTADYSKDMAFELKPYSVSVIEIVTK